ncbi:MAG: hypothetical protein N2999_05425 [Proteobacteria bacterium]|nr:hypothetical protein [Pseudomonadota bacterium]
MKALFKPQLVNKPYEDPLLYIDLFGRKESFIVDLGDISKLSNRKILRISRCFITHTHIDHFFGFDGLLRTSLGKKDTIFFYGPKGIIENIKGKLKGYNFNLIKEYPINISVYEIRKDKILKCLFSAERGFKASDIEEDEWINNIIYEDNELFVKALLLNHKIPVLCYLFEEKKRLNINKDGLNKLGVITGPWLTELKRLYLDEDKDSELEVPTKEGLKKFKSSYLFEKLLIIKDGEKIFYLTDIKFSLNTLRKIKSFVQWPDLFYCEAFFTGADEERAKDRYHLTSKQTNFIAKSIGAKKLIIFHFSPRYKGNFKKIYHEALEGF